MSNELLELYNVGTIYIEVGEDAFGCYEAKTVDVLGGADLGAEITVRMWDFELYEEDDEERTGELERGSVKMWRVLLLRMRDVLARFMLLGKMQPGKSWGSDLNEQEEKNLTTATSQLENEGAFDITPQATLRALYTHAAKEEAFDEGVQNILELMKSAMKPGETNITLGEAMERLEKEAEGDEAEDK